MYVYFGTGPADAKETEEKESVTNVNDAITEQNEKEPMDKSVEILKPQTENDPDFQENTITEEESVEIKNESKDANKVVINDETKASDDEICQLQKSEQDVQNTLAQLHISDKSKIVTNESASLQDSELLLSSTTNNVHQEQNPIQTNKKHEDNHQIQKEDIRNQLEEIVSDIDRAVEQNQIFDQTSSIRTTTSINSTSADNFTKTIINDIWQPTYAFSQVGSIS